MPMSPARHNRPERQPLAPSVSDELVRLAIESIKDYAIFLLDLEGRITSWNLGAERMMGWREEEVMGQPISRFFPAEDVAAGQMELELRTAAIGGHYEGNGWRLHKSGRRFWAEVSVRVLRGEAGQTRGFVKVMRDITERRQADEERQLLLRELEARQQLLDAVLKQMPAGILIAQRMGEVYLANQQMEELFRHPFSSPEAAGAQGPVPYQGFHPDGRPLQPTDWPLARSLLAGETVTGEELEVLRGDGTRVVLQANSAPVRNRDGQLVAGVVMALDITERRRAEEELRRRAEFEQHLIGIVSHDLRTPLSAILVGASALKREAGLPERARRAAERIESSARRATRMTRDLLDFTQARLGRGIPVYPAPLDAHELVRQVVEEISAGAPEREVRVEVQGEGRGEWDPDRLAQVLTNLVANALQYSPEGTPVTVRAAGAEDSLVLEVHNHGEPIAPEQQARLFEPMRRGARERGSASRSVGLGLYIVRHLVEAHGGGIRVRSEPQAGTTFSIRLPRRGPAAPRPQ